MFLVFGRDVPRPDTFRVDANKFAIEGVIVDQIPDLCWEPEQQGMTIQSTTPLSACDFRYLGVLKLTRLL